MKKITFILISIAIAISLEAQPLGGWTGSTENISNITFLGTKTPSWWGIDIFMFSVQFYDDNDDCLLSEPILPVSYSHDKFSHHYPDITSSISDVEIKKGISSWAIYFIPPLNMPKPFKALYLGIGFGINTSYDIITTHNTNFHRYAPIVTSETITETKNKKRMPSINLNLRYNLLDLNLDGDGFNIYVCPTLTLTTYRKIKPTIGFAIGFGIRQRDTIEKYF